MTNEPTWLKSTGNGALGEARIRAILLERFNVLSRSVDLHGADFFIELRRAGRFSQDLAPRLGIVQAKFAQDNATSHEIPSEYLIDQGVTIDEFFVIVTVGREDAVTHHLLSAADVATLPQQRRRGKDVHLLSGKDRARFAVKSVSELLDRIEHSLLARTEKQNDRFLHTVNIPDFDLKRGFLDPSWLLPIPNEHGYVPDLIYQLRLTLRSTLYLFDDIVGPIQITLKTRDAETCVTALGDLLSAYGVEVEGEAARVEFDLSRLPNTLARLKDAVAVHARRYNRLVDRDRLATFLNVASAVQSSHEAFIEQHREPRRVWLSASSWRVADDHAATRVHLDPSSLDAVDVETTLVPVGTELGSRPDELVASRELWRYAIEGGASTWRELDRLNHELMAQHYRLLFPDEIIGKLILPLYMTD